jgi:hypothetical protein
MLDAVAAFEQQSDIEQQVRVLNLAKDQSIDVEWELAALFGLARCARVEHHVEFGDGVRLDAVVSDPDDAQPLFAADITAASESGRRELNPIDFLRDELLRRVRRTTLRPNSFSLHYEGRREGPPGKSIMRLLVPTKRNVPAFFDSEFSEFLRACLANPEGVHRFRRATEDVQIEIGYDPTQPFFTGGGPSFETSYSLTRNPVHNALIRKARQLRRASADLPVGIILCSVDTNLKANRPIAPAVHLTTTDIVRHFLENNTSVSFVVTLEVVQEYLGSLRGLAAPAIRQFVYSNPNAGDRRLSTKGTRILESLASQLPRPINTGTNAISHLQSARRNEGRSLEGSFEMSENTLRISSRALLEYLAGQITPEKFSGSFRDSPSILRLFESFRGAGRTIEGVSVERNPDHDDDWVTFRFSAAPDPAIAPFRVPSPADRKPEV